jgi:hypothetical protein
MIFSTQGIVSLVTGVVLAGVVSVGGTAALKSSTAGEAGPKDPNSVSYADE